MSEKVEYQTVMAAQPGFELAQFDEGYGSIYYEQIIAWDIVVRRFDIPGEQRRMADVLPITIDGLADEDSDEWLIKRPNGVFTGPFKTNMTEAEALEWFIKHNKHAAARKTAS